MKKTWLTAVSVAGVLGTGSAAVMAGAGLHPPSQLFTAGISLPRSTVYQVGTAARIEVTEAAGMISIISATPTSGWTVRSTSGAGSVVTVVLTDGTQVVTFTASMAGGTVHADVTSALSPAPAIAIVPAATIAPAVVAPAAAQAPLVTPSEGQPITAASTTGESKAGASSRVGTTSQHDDDDNESDDQGVDSNDD